MEVVHLSVCFWPGQGALHEGIPLSLGGELELLIQSFDSLLAGFTPLGAAQHKLGENKEQVTTVRTLLIKWGWVFQDAQTDALPKTDEFPGNVSFRSNRFGSDCPYVLPLAWAWPSGGT